jgi:hypothetical protein
LLDMHYKTQVTNTAIFEVIFQRGLQFLTWCLLDHDPPDPTSRVALLIGIRYHTQL